MTVCANHNEIQATAYCRTCGKPLCDNCKRDVRGVIYCESCIAARLSGTLPADPVAVVAPPAGLPNPTLAAFLGVIPGVGAFYNGQYMKGLIHIAMLPMLAALANMEDMFGLLFIIYFPYMIVDAYQTAKARVLGQPVPDMLGINSLFGDSTPKGVQATPDDPQAAATAPTAKAGGPPLGAIILIGMGCVFLFSTTGILPMRFMRAWWAMLLIVIGIWQGMKVMAVRQDEKDWD
jgi:hypothetical protein